MLIIAEKFGQENLLLTLISSSKFTHKISHAVIYLLKLRIKLYRDVTRSTIGTLENLFQLINENRELMEYLYLSKLCEMNYTIDL